MLKPLLTSVALLLSSAALTAAPGCGFAILQQATFKKTTTITVPHVSDKGLDVEAGNGAIEVLQESRADVSIEVRIAATTQERLDGVTITSDRNDQGTLVIRAVWPGGKALDNEQCAFVIRTPGADGVKLHTVNGAIKCQGQSGDGTFKTTNGAVEIATHDGPVTVETTNGAAEVTLADDAAGPVTISTMNGSVELAVGPAFAGELEATTSNGHISCAVSSATASGGKGRQPLKLVFGAKGEPSKIKTTNGSIEITQRSGK